MISPSAIRIYLYYDYDSNFIVEGELGGGGSGSSLGSFILRPIFLITFELCGFFLAFLIDDKCAIGGL
jgi:hypothetical protein